jgi:hypothetical protein
MLWVRLGLWVSNEPLYVLGAGQQGLGPQDKPRDCYPVYTAGLTKV